jgi:multidrug efflux system membrane fusion protein
MSAARRTIVFLVVCLLVGGAVVAAYYVPLQKHEEPQKRGRRAALQATDGPVPVLAIAAKAADVPVYLNGVGTARALNTVTVRPQVDGKIINISFTEGQDVPKGFVLAKIDPTTYQAQYDQVVAKKAQDEAQLANARLDLERYIKLAASNAINKQQLDTQKALVKQLEALVQLDQAVIDNARAILSYTDIVAPIAGRTGLRLVDEGNLVRAGDLSGIVVITEIRPIAILFNLPQQNLPELHKGLAEGPLPVDALGPDGKTAIDKGKVVVIDNQVDQTTGTVRLKAEFPNANLQLWPGQFVNVRLLIDLLRQVVVVPTAAVQRGPSGTFVYVVKDDNTVTVRRVRITQQDDREAVIGRGLTVGERVVTTGFARLTEGTEVVATNAEGAGQVSAAPAEGERRERGKGKGKGKGKRNQGSGGSPGALP